MLRELAREVRDLEPRIEQNDPGGLRGGDRQEAVAHAPVEVERLALEPVRGTGRLRALEAEVRRQVEKERQVGRHAAARERVEALDGVERQPAAVALVGDRGVGETIGDDHRAAGERRLDQAADVLGAVREVEQQLGLCRRPRRVVLEQHAAQRPAELGAARLARQHDLVSVAAQRIREARGLRALAGAFDAVDGDEARHDFRGRRHAPAARVARKRAIESAAASPLRTQSARPTPW